MFKQGAVDGCIIRLLENLKQNIGELLQHISLKGRRGSYVSSAEAAETAALNWAFEEAHKRDLHPFILCSDSLSIIQYLKGEAISVGIDQQVILGDVKSRVQSLSYGNQCVFCNVDRNFVVGAHVLANIARMDPYPVVYDSVVCNLESKVWQSVRASFDYVCKYIKFI